MRHPNHIVLDFNQNSTKNTSNYWVSNFFNNQHSNYNFISYTDVNKKYLFDKRFLINHVNLKNIKKYKMSSIYFSNSLSNLDMGSKEGIVNLFNIHELNKDDKKLLNFTDHKIYNTYNILLKGFGNYNKYKLLNNVKYNLYSTGLPIIDNSTFNLVNINFLKKERLYTKLKYSRSPAYDIVSGGAAALLAGFIGFLISEKFGFELVDSGDFYYLFMYGVFLSFMLRPLIIVSDHKQNLFEVLSPKPIIFFFLKMFIFFLKYFRNK